MKKFIYVLLALVFATDCIANNILISNVSIVNNGAGNVQVKFDVSWENSWRVNVGPNNYDGAWVFFKYKTATGNWIHMTMTGSNNVIPTGFDVYQTNEALKTGAMIYREPTNPGVGSVSITNVRLGVVSTLPYDIDVKAFAIEMVFIPAPTTRPFFGDGNGTTESLNALHYTDNTATTGSVIPMKVDNNGYDDDELEGDVNSTGIYIYSNDTIQTTVPLGSLDPFPTMKALWCMKYEISQAAYRDFLNTLTYDQQDNRTVNPPNSATGIGAMGIAGSTRQYIETMTPGVANTTPALYGCDANGNNVYNEATDGEWVACGGLGWTDVAAFLDWAGLAPMTEIQYERICRGHSSAGARPAILGEFAWGDNTIFSSPYTLTGNSSASELASNASFLLGNANYSSTYSLINGPVRNGIFATSTSNRETSGAGFFGVMEMSGNVYEFVITIGVEAGRSVGLVPNGNGTISASGNAQLSVGGAGFWPGMEGNNSLSTANTCSGTCEVTASGGIVLKGGSYTDAGSALAISQRNYGTPTVRSSNRGGRGVLYIR
jgi:formylglycine-generating enzyme required for sulfatase activity